MARLEDVLDIPMGEGRRGLERAKAIVTEILNSAVPKAPAPVAKVKKIIE